jgi:ribosome-associated toxin RatA of RatAB toxin-antitoxin module
LPNITRRFTLKAPLNNVVRVASDPTQYHRFLSFVKQAIVRTEERDADMRVARQLDVAVAYRDTFNSTARIDHRFDPQVPLVTIKQSTKGIIQFEASCRFFASGNGTLLELTCDYEPGNPVLGLLINMKIGRAMDQIAQALDRFSQHTLLPRLKSRSLTQASATQAGDPDGADTAKA